MWKPHKPTDDDYKLKPQKSTKWVIVNYHQFITDNNMNYWHFISTKSTYIQGATDRFNLYGYPLKITVWFGNFCGLQIFVSFINKNFNYMSKWIE